MKIRIYRKDIDDMTVVKDVLNPPTPRTTSCQSKEHGTQNKDNQAAKAEKDVENWSLASGLFLKILSLQR